MNQLSIFTQKPADAWTLYIDGASRNNPGPASLGIHLMKNNKTFNKVGYYLGTKTNNQAEYAALIVGLMVAKEHMAPEDKLSIKSDSLLLVRQIAGQYALKNAELKKLYLKAQELLRGVDFEINHIYREHNTVADQMANEAIDKKIVLPTAYAYE